jgi:hypothetical protein
MDKPRLTQNRIILAFAVAIIADVIQFPITAVEATGILSIPGELADFVLDCFVMVATCLLLGFHWALLPSLFVELVPGLDLLPTWTACVAFVVWQGKKEQAHTPPIPPVVDVEAVEVVSAPTSARITPPPLPPIPRTAIPAQSPPPIDTAVESRLKSLNELREKGLISQSEYDTKRQQILAEL